MCAWSLYWVESKILHNWIGICARYSYDGNSKIIERIIWDNYNINNLSNIGIKLKVLFIK